MRYRRRPKRIETPSIAWGKIRHATLLLPLTLLLILSGCETTPRHAEKPTAPTPAPEKSAARPASPFPTFKDTGQEVCTDESGRPVILLFTDSSCPHCQWVGGVFDAVVREYMKKGLVTAHHYDIRSRDDLLTKTVETRIPKVYLRIGKRGDPDGYVPYFNFGCKYDRIGNGYEAQGDLAAEAEEMTQVIEALLHRGSSSPHKILIPHGFGEK